MKFFKKFFVYTLVFSLPLTAFARSGGVNSLLGSAFNIVNYLIKVALALGLLFFFWGLAQFLLHPGDEEKQKSSKRIMIWGVIALFVMASITGIIAFVQQAFSLPQTTNGTGGSLPNGNPFGTSNTSI